MIRSCVLKTFRIRKICDKECNAIGPRLLKCIAYARNLSTKSKFPNTSWSAFFNCPCNSTYTMSDKVVCLFDVDGTLTAPRQIITNEMKKFLFDKVKPRCILAVVGGSDIGKIAEQLGGMDVINDLDYVFAENGLIAINKGKPFGSQTIQNYIGEEKLQQFINYCLRYMSEITLPVKRGTFIEFRTGMINVSPVGRSCSRDERNQFEQYDKVHNIRKKFIESIKKEFPDLDLKYSIGGQISFDVFPNGWDKTYCLQYLKEFPVIHFFGDKTDVGGNDYEVFLHEETIGHKVTSPSDTMSQLIEILKIDD